MAIYMFLFDADGQDRQVDADPALVRSVGENQILWVDVTGVLPDEYDRVADLLDFPVGLRQTMRTASGERIAQERPRLDLYATCFHCNVDTIESSPDSRTALRRLWLDFVVFPNIVVTFHEQGTEFLTDFDRRIKGDTQLGKLDGPAFLGALLNWHVTSYFRVLERLESEADRIDDAALRMHDDQDLLEALVQARRRVALVRQTLLPHREVYANLARPHFAPFVTDASTETLTLMYERMEQAIEMSENTRELVLGSFTILTTQTTLRTNQIVKMLTLLSSVLLPVGVLASLALFFIRTPVYPGGAPAFWALITFIASVLLLGLTIARRRRWL